MGKRFIKLRKQYKKENLEAKHFIAQFKQKQDLTNKFLFRENPVIFKTNLVMYMTNSVICMSNPVIFMTNQVIFRTNP